MKYKVLIVDDERAGRENLSLIIKKNFPELEISGLASNINEAEKSIEEIEPDIVFLDIQMPGGSGFELIREDYELNFELIFVTSFDQYAVRAFKVDATDYILKPIDIHDLERSITRAISNIKTSENLTLLNKVKSAEKNTLILSDKKGKYLIRLDELVRLESDNYYTSFFLQSGERIVVSKTMKSFEDTLDDKMFYRIHQSHIVNKNFVKAFNTSTMELELINGYTIPVSVRRRNKARRIFDGA